MHLSTAQACGRIGVSRPTMAKLIASGEIEAIKGTAKNSHIKIPEASVNAYLAQRKMPTASRSTYAGLSERERHRRFSFRERFVYVVEFASGIVKVGYTDYPERRFRELAWATGDVITQTWASPLHLNGVENERQLIFFCAREGRKVGRTYEFFTGVDFEKVVSFAGGLEYRQTPDAVVDAHIESRKRWMANYSTRTLVAS